MNDLLQLSFRAPSWASADSVESLGRLGGKMGDSFEPDDTIDADEKYLCCQSYFQASAWWHGIQPG